MNMDEQLIINCKKSVDSAIENLNKVKMVLDAMYADHAIDDRKIDESEIAEMKDKE